MKNIGCLESCATPIKESKETWFYFSVSAGAVDHSESVFELIQIFLFAFSSPIVTYPHHLLPG